MYSHFSSTHIFRVYSTNCTKCDILPFLSIPTTLGLFNGYRHRSCQRERHDTRQSSQSSKRVREVTTKQLREFKTMMSKSLSSAFLILASVLQTAGGFHHDLEDAESLRMRSVQVGASYCTDAPDLECYPSTNGFPGCCGVPDTCPVEKQPCENGTPVATPTLPTLSPAPSPSGVEPGDSYCTFSPDLECYPSTNGYPACCADDPETCPVSRPACEDEVGGDYCTFAPDYDCYAGGWPMCCRAEGEADCPAERPACESASDVPSMVPTPASSGGSKTTLPTQENVGGDYCTFAPDLQCYPSTNGFPACCGEDSASCPADRPPCENTSTTAPTDIKDAATITAAPAPSRTAEGPTGGSPGTSSAVAVSWTAPAVALFALVGVTVVHVGLV
jgi:hypothetical protein